MRFMTIGLKAQSLSARFKKQHKMRLYVLAFVSSTSASASA